MDLNDRFNALDDNLKLDVAERARAITAHNRLSAVLVTAGVAKRTRLQGSFARKTMLPPLHDIDKVVELVDELRDLLDGPAGPAKAIDLIRDTLEPHFPGATFDVKKHALGIVLPGDGFDFDAVPAFNPDDSSGWISIADTEDADWEPSNTYMLIDTISTRNQACDGRFVHQVRMVKQAVSTAGLADILPGLHAETFVFEAVTASMQHPDAVSATLATGAALLGGPYTEPTGVDLISSRLKPTDVAAAKAALARLAQLAAEAVRLAAAGDETAAAHIWADIFGEAFPRPTGEEAFIQGLYGAGVATTSPSPARATPTTRAWRPA